MSSILISSDRLGKRWLDSIDRLNVGSATSGKLEAEDTVRAHQSAAIQNLLDFILVNDQDTDEDESNPSQSECNQVPESLVTLLCLFESTSDRLITGIQSRNQLQMEITALVDTLPVKGARNNRKAKAKEFPDDVSDSVNSSFSRGGPLPIGQHQSLQLQRDAIILEKRMWVFMESMRLIAKALQRKYSNNAVPAATINVAKAIMSALLRFTHSAYVQSHATSNRLLVDLGSLSPALMIQLQHWCLAQLRKGLPSSAAAVSQSLSSSNDFDSLIDSDSRCLCALLYQLIAHNNQRESQIYRSFEQEAWQLCLTVLHSSTHATLRQQILRLLLPTFIGATTGSLITERINSLHQHMIDMWQTAITSIEAQATDSSSVVAGSSSKSTSVSAVSSALRSSILLSPSCLSRIIAVQPPLAHLLDMYTAHYTHVFGALAEESRQRDLDEWLMEVLLCGLVSQAALHRKQASFLLRMRQQLKSMAAPPMRNFSAVDYSATQWSCFHQVFDTLEGSSIHLVESVLPRLSVIMEATRQMDEWLELLLWKGLTHVHPSIASCTFQKLYELAQADAKTHLTSNTPHRLSPSMILGPIAKFFDNPSLYSADVERRGANRLGSANWEPFLVDFIERLPSTASSEFPASKSEFLRVQLSGLTHINTNSSLHSLLHQLSALTQLTPTHCLSEAEVTSLWLIIFQRVRDAPSRLREELLIHVLQIFCLHANLQSSLDASLVIRLLLEFPLAWLRPNCFSAILLRDSLGAPTAQSQQGNQPNWMELQLPNGIEAHFHKLLRYSTKDLDINVDDIKRANEGLLRLLLLVPADSELETRVLRVIEDRLSVILTNNDLDLRGFFGSIDFLCAFHRTFESSAQLSKQANQFADKVGLETIAFRLHASSERLLTPLQLQSAARSSDDSDIWSTRLQWSHRLIEVYGVNQLPKVQSWIQQSNTTTEQTVQSVARALADAVHDLLAHRTFSSFRFQLMHYTVGLLRKSQFFTLSTDTPVNREFTIALLFAVINNSQAPEFIPMNLSGSLQSSIDEWLQSSVESPLAAEGARKYPLFLANYLVQGLAQAEAGRRPSDTAPSDWKMMQQRFSCHRWQMLSRLLTIDANAEEGLMLWCVDQLDSATESYVQYMYDCIRMLLPGFIRANTPSGSSFDVSQLSPIYRSAWNSFRGELHDYHGAVAFFALMFEPTAFALEANHAVDGPFHTIFKTMLAYNKQRFLVYLSIFFIMSLTRFPTLLRCYTRQVVSLCIYLAEQSSEVELINEKLRVYQLAHLIHNFSFCTDQELEKGTQFIASNQLRRAESIVRCVSLLFVQNLDQMASRYPVDSRERNQVEEAIVQLARELMDHPSMLSDKGCMSGEGNPDFIAKIYLWQTMCILVRAVVTLDASRCKSISAQLEAHAWTWFDRALTSSLRHLLEVFIANFYANLPDALTNQLQSRLRTDSNRPTLLASLIVILASATMYMPDKASRLAQAKSSIIMLHPFTACNFGHVRLVAQYLYYQLVSELAPAEWKTSAASEIALPQDSTSVDSACVRAMWQYLDSDVDMCNLRVRQHAYFARFNPLVCSTVSGLLNGGDEHHYFVQQSVLDVITELQRKYLSVLRDSYDDYRFHANADQQQASDNQASLVSSASEDSKSASSYSSSTGLNFQQKVDVSPLSHLLALDELRAHLSHEATQVSELESASTRYGVTVRDAVTQRAQSARQSVIVVASLVGKLPNLAGLSRTCEIFQAERLMISDLSLIKEHDFTAVSVTAEKWLPIEELKPEDIKQFMRARQAEGYTCIALEQSANSITLPNYQFPEKIVILLGAEKTGVPVDLLNEVDQCVEIPQLGILRSLNVHVSGSILLWEYSRQKLLGLTAPSEC